MLFNPLKRLKPIEWMLAILLLIAPFYFHTNLGGTGLRLPNNITVWSIASLIAFYSLYLFTTRKTFYAPRYFLFIVAFPVILLVSGILSGIEIIEAWAFRLLFIWGGLLFLFGLFQHHLKQGRIDRLLFVVMLSGLLHALVGLAQIILVKAIPVWLPFNANAVPTGFFQQINNQASFQVTTIIIAFWLTTRPFIRHGHRYCFILVLITLCLSGFILSYSGSRVGALGFILALPLFIASRYTFIKADKKRWGIISLLFIVVISSASFVEKNQGLSNVIEKTTALNAGFSGTARLGMYAIALDVIEQAPILGHGIGSFVRVWQLAKPKFYAEHPDAKLPNQRVAHPHNELIFWLVEGGLIAGLGLVFVLVGILLTLKKLPPSRRYIYTAFLLPIGLHTQVELPFYISASHWFVFLLLLFVVMQPRAMRLTVKLSPAASKTIKLFSVVGAFLSTGFFAHSMASNIEFEHYLLHKPKNMINNPFPIAMHNPYFKTLAAQQVMTDLLYSSMRYGIKDNVMVFVEWSSQEIKRNPHISYYRLTIQAYQYLNQHERACFLAREAKTIYPYEPALPKIIDRCNREIF